MKNFGINLFGVKKYLNGADENGILLLYNGPTYSEIDLRLRKSNPIVYNLILMNASRKNNPSSEVVRYKDSNGNIKTTTNVKGMSGADPVMADYVMGVAMAKPLLWVGKLVLYGMGKAGNNWARARLISRELNNAVDKANLHYFLTIPTGYPRTSAYSTTNTGFQKNSGLKSVKHFKDDYGREVTPTPYPGPDSDLVNAVGDAWKASIRDYFSPDKIKQIKKTMGWGDKEISELQNEILRTIGQGPEILVKGPEDGFTIIASHQGKLFGTGPKATSTHLITLNRERIPDLLTAIEGGIHEIGVHGKTASMKAGDFGKGGASDKAREMFPRLAELTLKNKEFAENLLVSNRRGLFLSLFKNVGDLEKYFVDKNLSWKDKWDKFYNNFRYYKYITRDDELTARGYTGQLFNKVFDSNKKTLNIELLEKFYTPESVESFKKAVLGVTPIIGTTTLNNDK